MTRHRMPSPLDTLAAAIGEDKGTLEDLIEPFLLQEGYLERTPRGRVVTRRALGRIDMQDRTYGWTVEM